MARPLLGIRALVTRPAAQGDVLCSAIRAAGGEALCLPLLEIDPLPIASVAPQLGRLAQHDIAVFVSANAVRHAMACLRETGSTWPRGVPVLAIGSATRSALAEAGIAASAGSVSMNSEELLQQPLLGAVEGKRVMIFKGEGGRDLLAEQLSERGAEIAECVLYVRRASAVTPAEFVTVLGRDRINAILAASGEALQILLGLLRAGATGTMNTQPVLVVPGQRVAGIATGAGIGKFEIAANATDAAMLEALARIAPRLRTRMETG